MQNIFILNILNFWFVFAQNVHTKAKSAGGKHLVLCQRHIAYEVTEAIELCTEDYNIATLGLVEFAAIFLQGLVREVLKY